MALEHSHGRNRVDRKGQTDFDTLAYVFVHRSLAFGQRKVGGWGQRWMIKPSRIDCNEGEGIMHSRAVPCPLIFWSAGTNRRLSAERHRVEAEKPLQWTISDTVLIGWSTLGVSRGSRPLREI